MSNEFCTFAHLPEKLQKEAIREGELRLAAQLTIAADADRRALTWSGFVFAGTIALFGAGFRTIGDDAFDQDLPLTALLVGSLLLLSAFLAMKSIDPREFCPPGTRPGLWLPNQWDSAGCENRVIQKARAEQAQNLDSSIKENAKFAAENAKLMRMSLRLALFAVFTAAIILLLKLAF